MKQGIYESSSVAEYPIGKRLAMDERVFRYGKIFGVASLGGRAVANLGTAEEVTTATVLAAIGGVGVTITVVASAGLVENELQGGYLCYKKTRYYRHRIRSHPAAENGATCVLTLETPIVGHAIAVGDTLIAYHNPWAKVGSAVTYGSGVSFVGMPFGDIAVGQYTWLQTWGPTNMTPGAFYGGLANMRQVWFAADGALAIFPAGSWTGAYQHAGFLIPNTFYSATLHNLADGGHLMFLQIAP